MMPLTERFGLMPDESVIQRATVALEQNGIEIFVVADGAAAKEKLFSLLPAGAEVMNMSSVTLATIGAEREITGSGRYRAVRDRLTDQKISPAEKRRLGAAPEWVTGSVHAVTEEGQVLVASASGSQISAYVYGAANVIWVVGAQKIVKNLEEGMRRLYEYCLPLENERAQKVYGSTSAVNVILIYNKNAFSPGRIKMIIVREKLGF